MKYTMKVLGLMVGVGFLVIGPGVKAATEIGGYPCYGTLPIYVDGKPTNPCDKANDFIVREAWRDASITGWNGPQAVEPVRNVDTGVAARLSALEVENENLRARVRSLEQRENQVGSVAPIQQAPVIVASDGSFGARITSLEKEVRILQGVVSMMEVNIGSLYARMDQLLSPIKRALNLK